MRRLLAVAGAALLMSGPGALAEGPAPGCASGACPRPAPRATPQAQAPDASVPSDTGSGSLRPKARPFGATGAGGTGTGKAGAGPTLAEAPEAWAGPRPAPGAAPGLGAGSADGSWSAPGAAALDAPPTLDPETPADPCPFVAADPVRLTRLAAVAGEAALRAEAPFRLPQARVCGGG